MSISKGEEILLVGLQQLALKLPELKKYMGDYDDEVDDVSKLIDATLNMYEKEGFGKPAIQFNPGVYGEKRPLDWHEEGFKDFHPAIRSTSYGEIHELLGTSGCSPEDPYWVWSVCGVIQGVRGRQVVCPNDWILEPYEGVFIVVPDSVYRSSQKESNNAAS